MTLQVTALLIITSSRPVEMPFLQQRSNSGVQLLFRNVLYRPSAHHECYLTFLWANNWESHLLLFNKCYVN